MVGELQVVATAFEASAGITDDNHGPFEATAAVRFDGVTQVDDDRAVEHGAVAFGDLGQGVHRAGDETGMEGADLFHFSPGSVVLLVVEGGRTRITGPDFVLPR